jgi:hypothetical protein
MNRLFFSFFLVLLLIQGPLFSQENAEINNQSTNQETTEGNAGKSEYYTLKRNLTYGAIIGSFAVTYIYGSDAWDWGGMDYRWAHEGWFGADTDSGGIDKIGHMWAHYVVQRGFNNLFEYTLEDKKEALIVSTATAASVGLLIEIGDGTSGKYGFS